VRIGICSHVKQRAFGGCLVQRVEFDLDEDKGGAKHCLWSLLADALDTHHVNLRMISQLLQLGAEPDFIFYLPSKIVETTPLRIAVSRASEHQSEFEEMRVLVEMADVSERKNLPKDEEDQLNHIMKGSMTGRR
jgi:hypothetical protein